MSLGTPNWALTVKTTCQLSARPLSRKISTPSAPLRERGSAVCQPGTSTINGETPMKSLVSMIVALGIAVAFTAPTFAADKAPTTKADCEKAKMKWDDAAKKCS